MCILILRNVHTELISISVNVQDIVKRKQLINPVRVLNANRFGGGDSRIIFSEVEGSNPNHSIFTEMWVPPPPSHSMHFITINSLYKKNIFFITWPSHWQKTNHYNLRMYVTWNWRHTLSCEDLIEISHMYTTWLDSSDDKNVIKTLTPISISCLIVNVRIYEWSVVETSSSIATGTIYFEWLVMTCF